jgi:hypothetical protein
VTYFFERKNLYKTEYQNNGYVILELTCYVKVAFALQHVTSTYSS